MTKLEKNIIAPKGIINPDFHKGPGEILVEKLKDKLTKNDLERASEKMRKKLIKY